MGVDERLLWAPLNSFGNFDGQQNEYKASKLAIMEIWEKQDMLNRSHSLSKYKTNGGENQATIF